ncbi:MAG TPA: hypothetical protein DEB09_04830 [Candidatus Magasanikbacteria bacterium]|nr:hypothetical protein [Candidatus Magasanikbacteria bacterium]
MIRKLFCSKFCLIFLVVLVGLGFLAYKSFKTLSIEKIFQSTFVQDQVKKQVGDENKDLIQLAPRLLGFSKPMTYLFIFENNTELRPSGGFIGVYAIVKIDKGSVNIVKLDGTENLDRYTPEDFKIVPPDPLSKHLGVDRWYFRDANWSPDFSESAKQMLTLYKGENGVEANNIDAVIAVTPVVLERLLEKIGPVSVDGVEFTAKIVTEKLEYEVEYEFANKGIDKKNRKDIVGDLMSVVMNKVKTDFIFDLNGYLKMFNEIAEQRHVMVYSLEPDLEKIIKEKGWSGEVKSVAGDYLLWVDANLAALKTDYSINRELKYSVKKDETGKLVATAEMLYNHTGIFDWRTTRYRTYTRIFVPVGSELISADGVMKWDRTKEKGEVDKGEELGKQWFGAFIAIEPGQTKSLKFTYYLPESVIKDNVYTLFVQKQLGTLNNKLTLDQNFGKNIVSAKPAEADGEWGDQTYRYVGDLQLDRQFEVMF